jgi:hypothetical protein
MEAIDAFLKSETGYLIGLILTFLGVTDLAGGWYILRHRPELLPLPPEGLQRLITMLFFAASFMLLLGLYTLAFHF